MASTKPTIVFVCGSWHTEKHYDHVRKVFEEHGYPTSCTRNPSVSGNPENGMLEDAETLRKAVTNLVNGQSKEAIVFAHSYGGIIATQALSGDLGKEARSKAGKAGGIVRLVYYCAFILPVGKSLHADGGIPPFIQTFEVRLILVDKETALSSLVTERPLHGDWSRIPFVQRCP
jgi:pimeloyl-ACP methyl ester carboxylesterase